MKMFTLPSLLPTLFFFIAIAASAAAAENSPQLQPTLCAASALSSSGYFCQDYNVRTEDGYVLGIQRIPRGRSEAAALSFPIARPPVLIQHGVLVDGMTWLLNPPDHNLPLILADAGFDVWIVNTRGTRYSRRHVSLEAHQPEYWNWSWDELVAYDLPAIFDLVFRETGQKSHYVGHSQGTLIMLASLSEGRLMNRIRSAALLSPVAYLSHITTALGLAAAKAFLGEITGIFGFAEFNPRDPSITIFLQSLCQNPGIDCYDLLSAITGHNCCLNISTVEIFLKNEPQSTSTKNMVHLSQIVRDRKLSKYNYENAISNMGRYGSVVPPEYKLSNVPKDFPLFITYGGQDSLSDIRDVEDLLDIFKEHNESMLSTKFIKDYAHADFIMGITAKDLVYTPIVSFFKRQN